jgi:hypothetical protein
MFVVRLHGTVIVLTDSEAHAIVQDATGSILDANRIHYKDHQEKSIDIIESSLKHLQKDILLSRYYYRQARRKTPAQMYDEWEFIMPDALMPLLFRYYVETRKARCIAIEPQPPKDSYVLSPDQDPWPKEYRVEILETKGLFTKTLHVSASFLFNYDDVLAISSKSREIRITAKWWYAVFDDGGINMQMTITPPSPPL